MQAALRERFHPWRRAADLGISVMFMPLPDGVLGCWAPDVRTIYLSPDLDQAERRSTLTHELIHAVRGDEPCVSTVLEIRQEAIVEAEAARLLIPLVDLAAALMWCHDESELADELWVDEGLVRARLDGLSAADKAFLEHALWDEQSRRPA
ncbi:MAG: ImmA/IrrE family metallo-endopeptidase [Candidatus Nanopelagicales bacterium]